MYSKCITSVRSLPHHLFNPQIDIFTTEALSSGRVDRDYGPFFGRSVLRAHPPDPRLSGVNTFLNRRYGKERMANDEKCPYTDNKNLTLPVGINTYVKRKCMSEIFPGLEINDQGFSVFLP